MTDSETLDSPKEKISNQDHFPGMAASMFSNLNIKNAIFLFLMGILIFSDVFIENVLKSFDGAVFENESTTKGTMIQLLVLVLGYLIVDLLVQGRCI